MNASGSDESQLHVAWRTYTEMLPCKLDKSVQCVVVEPLKHSGWQEWIHCASRFPTGLCSNQPGSNAPGFSVFEQLGGSFKWSRATRGIRSGHKSDRSVFVK